MKQAHKTLILWLLIIVVFVAFFQFFQENKAPMPREMAISDVMADAEAGKVRDIVVRGDTYYGHYKNDEVQIFRAHGFPMTAELEKRLRDNKVMVRVEPPPEPSIWVTILAQFLPIALLLIVFLFLMRQLQAGRERKMEFGPRRVDIKATLDSWSKQIDDQQGEIAALKERLSRIETQMSGSPKT